MAGAMRKMAVYLGLVEDDGYDGPGFDPDDEFEPEPDPKPNVAGARIPPRHVPCRGRSRSRCGWRIQPAAAGAANVRARPSGVSAPETDAGGSPPWHPSHLNVRTWRRTHR